MLNYIKEKLQAMHCDAYEITEKKVTGWEFYFIRHKLDQNRVKEETTITVSVYRSLEDGKFLGKATGEIFPTASREEVDKTLEDLYYQASLIKNPYYTLTDKPLPETEKIVEVDVDKIAEDFVTLMKEIPETEDKFLNSYEIFVNRVEQYMINSNGIEYRCTYPQSMLEYVVNARNGEHEIELYRIGDSGSCDKEGLKKEIMRTMNFGVDRLKAVPTPKMESIPVLLSTDVATLVYEYLGAQTNVGLKYMRVSEWEIGKPISEELRGDKVSIKVLRNLPNSSKNFDVDAEGSYIQERYLIRDGVVESYNGARQFSQYLGLEDNSIIYNAQVSGGTRSAEELRSGDYLEVVEFSDFSVDEMGGDIAGEIRLGYLHKDGVTTIVTGGSVAGNMEDALKDMTFSKETTQYDRYVIPEVTCLKNLRITGVV